MPQRRAKHWFYTLNNYTEDELLHLSCLPDGAVFHFFGKEVAGTGTPHLQGTLGYKTRQPLSVVRAHLSLRVHLEPTRNVLKSIVYCGKDGVTSSYGVVPVVNPCGKRSDLDDFKETVKAGEFSFKHLRDKHSEVLARYPRFCADYVRDVKPRSAPPPHPLRPWQEGLYAQLRHAADSRTITFVVDIRGNSGKSWFCDYYHYMNREISQVINPGKKADMAFALNEDIKVLFIDAPRSKQGEFIQYDFLEDVKNGRVFSGKYESGMKYLKPCHVVVMMNEEPDMTKLSPDRYNIIVV